MLDLAKLVHAGAAVVLAATSNTFWSTYTPPEGLKQQAAFLQKADAHAISAEHVGKFRDVFSDKELNAMRENGQSAPVVDKCLQQLSEKGACAVEMSLPADVSSTGRVKQIVSTINRYGVTVLSYDGADSGREKPLQEVKYSLPPEIGNLLPHPKSGDERLSPKRSPAP